MKGLITIITFCSFISTSFAQNSIDSDATLLKDVYRSQFSTYNTILDQDNYKSILNFGKQERSLVFKQFKGIRPSRGFIILEVFKPAWGNFVGVVWNCEVAYSYKRSSISKKLEIIKTDLHRKDFEDIAGIDSFIINKVAQWDVNFIKNTKNKIGAGVSDGYYFMATRIYPIKNSKENYKVETIAFDEFTR